MYLSGLLNPFADKAIQMVIMSGTATVLQQFVSGLKSRNEDTRAKSAKDLQHYVTTELREVPTSNTHGQKITSFLSQGCKVSALCMCVWLHTAAAAVSKAD